MQNDDSLRPNDTIVVICINACTTGDVTAILCHSLSIIVLRSLCKSVCIAVCLCVSQSASTDWLGAKRHISD